ncbi:MAG TPA: AMP-binding protein [Acidimicrobiales bacterium]|nr:AMP-binding protein [Acidimicrobiales bacterium]
MTDAGVVADGGVVLGSTEVPRARLIDDSRRAAAGLASMGIGSGDSVAVLLRNDVPFFTVTLATRTLGAYAVPINWHWRAGEIEHVLLDSGAKVLVVHADLLDEARRVVPDGVEVLVAPTPPALADAFGIDPARCVVAEGDMDWDAWVASFEPWTQARAGAAVSMIYTSGTTGKPKGVRRAPFTAEQAGALAEINEQVLGIVPRMRTLIPAPMYHSFGNAYAVGALLVRAHVVLQPRFDPEQLLALIDAHRITRLFMVPTMFVRLLQLPADVRDRYDVSSLEHVVHSAAPCPPEVKRAMIDWWGPIITEFYGSTESGPATACTSAEWLAKPGTVGHPVAGSEVVILGPDERALPPREIGDIYTRVPAYGDFTYQRREGSRREIDWKGFITSGDIGYLDEDGWLFISDRRADLIVSGGVNVYPAEVEAELVTMPGVVDAAVFGVADPEYGEAVVAAVQAEPGSGVTADDVRAFLSARIARYKVPRRVELVNELPREATGKLYRRKLRDAYHQAADGEATRTGP